MKILYLTDPITDYLADQIYTGLVRVLGNGQVVDFPYKAQYHDPNERVFFLPQSTGRRYEEQEIGALLSASQFDLLVLSSPREGVIRSFEMLAQRYKLPVRIVLDGEDDQSIRSEFLNRFGCHLYFKREYPCQLPVMADTLRDKVPQSLDRRVHPLSFSVILDAIPADVRSCEKDIDISYAGRVSHRKRPQAVALLQKARNVHFEGGCYAEATDRRSKLAASKLSSLAAKLCGDPYVSDAERGRKLSPVEYYKLLGRSKMGLSIRGGGFDTLRYWEIAASQVLLVSEQPDIVIPHNFEHGKHAVFCKPDLSDLVDLVRHYAQEDAIRIEMVKGAYDHLLQFHTCERRAEQLLATCKQLL